MLFRLTNAPATCQALINNVIRAHLDQTAITYLDDILVYSNTQQEHTKHVKDVLQCLQEAGLKLNLKKYEFVKAQAGTAELTEASVQRYTEQCSPDPVDEVDDV